MGVGSEFLARLVEVDSDVEPELLVRLDEIGCVETSDRAGIGFWHRCLDTASGQLVMLPHGGSQTK